MAIEDRTNPMQGVSGPGPFAKRTDLSYQSPEYGAGVAYEAAKSGAPLERAGGVKTSEAPQVAGGGSAAAPLTAGIGLFDPTQRPNEPITNGVAIGAGAGPEALMNRSQMGEKYSDTLAKLLPYDESGEVAILYQDMLARGL
jgi:hypothetical protein